MGRPHDLLAVVVAAAGVLLLTVHLLVVVLADRSVTLLVAEPKALAESVAQVADAAHVVEVAGPAGPAERLVAGDCVVAG